MGADPTSMKAGSGPSPVAGGAASTLLEALAAAWAYNRQDQAAAVLWPDRER